jgi:hypothetical protein
MKQIKALFGILVVIAAFYVVFKLMPPYYNNLQLQDAVDAEARNQSYTVKNEQEIRDLIIKRAKENDVLLRPEEIQVVRSGAEVTITVDYTVHVDLLVRPLDLKFHAGSKNKGM